MARERITLNLASRLADRLALQTPERATYLLNPMTLRIVKEGWDKRLSKAKIAKSIGWSESAVYKRWEEIERGIEHLQALEPTLSPTKPQQPAQAISRAQPHHSSSEGRWRRETLWP